MTQMRRYVQFVFFPLPSQHPQPQPPFFCRLTMPRTAKKMSAATAASTITFAMHLPYQKRKMIDNPRQHQRHADIIQRDPQRPLQRMCFMHCRAQCHDARHIEVECKDEGKCFRLCDCGGKCGPDRCGIRRSDT